jgi:hypothetical protein
LSQNGIIKREVGTVLADMLKANTVLTNLDISDCADYTAGPEGVGFARELAVGIKDNRALSMLDASDNSMFVGSDKTGVTAWAAALKASTSITELNLARNSINADDAKILAPAISDNGALTALDLSQNDIGGYYTSNRSISVDTTRYRWIRTVDTTRYRWIRTVDTISVDTTHHPTPEGMCLVCVVVLFRNACFPQGQLLSPMPSRIMGCCRS